MEEHWMGRCWYFLTNGELCLLYNNPTELGPLSDLEDLEEEARLSQRLRPRLNRGFSQPTLLETFQLVYTRAIGFAG